tara:strand:- start:42 stop:515 length:474 start_codon:yes stop_codon:yes gene_type:complete
MLRDRRHIYEAKFNERMSDALTRAYNLIGRQLTLPGTGVEPKKADKLEPVDVKLLFRPDGLRPSNEPLHGPNTSPWWVQIELGMQTSLGEVNKVKKFLSVIDSVKIIDKMKSRIEAIITDDVIRNVIPSIEASKEEEITEHIFAKWKRLYGTTKRRV